MEKINFPQKSELEKGQEVSIVKKKDQKSGKTTTGVLKEILTNKEFHSHGIKVKLETGEVGRVKKITRKSS